MEFGKLFDSHDWYKQALCRSLRDAGLFRGPVVLALASDLVQWTPIARQKYAKLFRVSNGDVFDFRPGFPSWLTDRADYIAKTKAELKLNDADVFLDPNTGLADATFTANSSKPANHIAVEEFQDITDADPTADRVYVFIQFVGGKQRYWEDCRTRLRRVFPRGKWSLLFIRGTVSGFGFLSKSSSRITAVKATVDEWLGPLATKRVNLE